MTLFRAELEVKNSEVEELNEAFKAVKQQMVAELEASTAIKDILESDLMSTKQALMEAQSHLILAEKVNKQKLRLVHQAPSTYIHTYISVHLHVESGLLSEF